MAGNVFKIIGFDHVQVAAPPGCEADARRFYGEVLGLPELPKPEVLRNKGGLWFQCGNRQLHIGVQENFHPALKAHPAIEVENIKALREYLIQKEVTLFEGESLDGIDRFFIFDPFGNRLELMGKVE